MGNFVTSSRETSANCERVWAILADVDRWPDRFTPHLREAQLAGELAPGAEGWVRMKLPMPRSAFTVTEVDPGRSWAWRGKILWLDMHYNHLCEPSSGGCRVTFRRRSRRLRGRARATARSGRVPAADEPRARSARGGSGGGSLAELGRCWRSRAVLLGRFAHQADGDATRIFDDRVAGTPEGVVRRA